MRGWTEAAFQAAVARDTGEVLWLEARGTADPIRAVRSTRLKRGCESAARAVTLLGLGCVASAAIPASALGPIGAAHASVDIHLVEPPAFAVGEALPIAIGPELDDDELDMAARPDPERQQQEVEAYLRFGSREVPRRIVETIVRAANATGVDAVYLMALADTESAFRPEAKAPTSSAEGLFQFVDRTWLEMVRTRGADHGLETQAGSIAVVNGRPTVENDELRAGILALRRDPYVAAVLAAEMLKQDAAMIGFRIGRQINRTEMYLAHFLGLEEAARFLTLRAKKRAPSAAKAFPAAARANAGIFFARGRRGKLRGLSVHQVYDRFDRLIGTRSQLYRDVAAAEAGTRA